MIVAILILGAIIVVFALNAGNSVRRQARKLHAKVIELDDVTQHDYTTITAKLGNPNAISNMPNGVTLVQWICPGYHVAMSFDKDDKCLGIDSEVVV